MGNVRLSRVREALNKEEKNLAMDFSKIEYFSKELSKEAKKIEIKDFELKNLLLKVCNKCNVISSDKIKIDKILRSL